MGKIMFLWGNGIDGQDGYSPNGKQWALGGDTFVVGCQIPDDAVILPQFNGLNPDMSNPRYNTKYGIYEPHCGLDKLKFAWGHDEYMYRMLVANECSIPREGLDMIRYHSAYPWHDKVSQRKKEGAILCSASFMFLKSTSQCSSFSCFAGRLPPFDEARGLRTREMGSTFQ